MSLGLPSTLSKILKPLACASLIRPASGPALGDQRTWRLTHTIPANFILFGAEKLFTWPPSSHAPLPAGGGGGGAEVGFGGGLLDPPSPPGIVSTWPTKIRVLFKPLADISAATVTP